MCADEHSDNNGEEQDGKCAIDDEQSWEALLEETRIGTRCGQAKKRDPREGYRRNEGISQPRLHACYSSAMSEGIGI